MIDTDKDFVRRQYAAERKAYTELCRTEENEAITAHFLQSALYYNARTVMCYVSMRREVDTHSLIKAMIRDGKTVCVPKITDRNGQMCAALIRSWDDLACVGPFGILEPSEKAEVIEPNEIDLIVVPAIAFTQTGHRLGMGGGYYDRFLSNTQAVRIGFAFSCQIKQSLPTDVWDAKMDHLVSREGITDCRTSKVQG